MMENKEFFLSLNINTKLKIKLGDGSCVDIVGYEVITLVRKAGEKNKMVLLQ